MSLLSSLLDHMPPQALCERDSLAEVPVSWPPKPVPAVVVAPVSGPYANAANATPEWRQARDLYISHVMVCRGCYAPAGRHCADGAALRDAYDKTPMETHP